MKMEKLANCKGIDDGKLTTRDVYALRKEWDDEFKQCLEK